MAEIRDLTGQSPPTLAYLAAQTSEPGGVQQKVRHQKRVTRYIQRTCGGRQTAPAGTFCLTCRNGIV